MRAIMTAAACAILFASNAAAQKLEDIPQEQAAPSVADTHWTGTLDWSDGEHRDMTVWFRPDGAVVYAYNGVTYDNGRWRQRGPLIFWETNDLYAAFIGQEARDQISGPNSSSNGSTGEWSITRDEAPPRAKADH